LRHLWGFIKILITKSNPDRLDANKSTALQCALQAHGLLGSDDEIDDKLRTVVSTLLRRQSSTTTLNHVNTDGKTSLSLYLHHWQRDVDFFRIVETFCSQGADTSAIVAPAFAETVTAAARLANATLVNNLQQTTDLPLWIVIWTSACEQTKWPVAECHLVALGLCTSEPPHPSFRDLACKVLLEKFLQSRRLQLEQFYSCQQQLFSEASDNIAHEYVNLLRASRPKQLQVDMHYWHFMTELHLLKT
jgi:hypothetical protein